ncbi:hypothetical protein [Roseivivax sp. THAF30]|nr:hypothetical protein [Roseivivax sp. THAF30]QFT62363.1 hypothetical protein FIU91_05430 [Roseivivax sp. THAF30]
MTREEMQARYKLAKAKVERHEQIEAGQASALAYAAFATKHSFDESGLLRSAAKAAELFCIAALGIVPILLFFYVV